jgi:hypothetical protein
VVASGKVQELNLLYIPASVRPGNCRFGLYCPRPELKGLLIFPPKVAHPCPLPNLLHFVLLLRDIPTSWGNAHASSQKMVSVLRFIAAQNVHDLLLVCECVYALVPVHVSTCPCVCLHKIMSVRESSVTNLAIAR